MRRYAMSTLSLAGLLLAPVGVAADETPTFSLPRSMVAFSKACQAKGSVTADSFEQNVKAPERKRRGWAIALQSEHAVVRLAYAKQIAEAAGAALHPVESASVVGKYIGETEKNLETLFEEAKRQDWVLFFDEADALFGKRSEVKDSHDRYASEAASTLPNRLLEYPGLIVFGTRSTAVEAETAGRLRDVVLTSPAPKGTVLPPTAWKTLCKGPKPVTTSEPRG
jgi:hypothetical protein